MPNMSLSTREEIINVAAKHGFEIVEKSAGKDLYNKLLTLKSPELSSNIYIDKTAGITKAGEINYLKVAVHPNSYQEDIESFEAGIRPALNQRTKLNQHSHSGYSGFPYVDEHDEPVAKAYQVSNLKSLEKLLSGFRSQNKKQTLNHSFSNLSEEFAYTSQEKIIETSSHDGLPTKALIIDEPWIDLILAGEKVWEMRSRSCSIRGRIGLIRKGSGQIVGTADLEGCLGPFSEAELKQLRDKHAITADRMADEAWMSKWNHAWVLKNVEALSEPVSYNHPNGAVTWVNIGKQD